ncbi:MAG: YXWGXW repeat-containing protein [Proteobacteria bacterium]|nr:YXWGXW repeat-containing protein [Pseudomonadota bacterium]
MNSPSTASRRSGLIVRSAMALAIAVAASSALFVAAPAQAGVDIGISVNFAPPPLPVYEQPMIPGPGYIWTPGYWAWDPADGYYWVPGTWVRPPRYGLLWTPGYWGWRDGLYVFYRGYWGPRVGYYGGINYGYGYGGFGYEGGYWRGNRFYYNRAVNNVNINITNVYHRTVINNVTINRYSYNGPGGATVRATAAQVAYQNQRHIAPVADQIRQRDAARADRSMRASINKGNPAIGATERAGVIARPSGLQDRVNAGRGGNPGAAGNDRAMARPGGLAGAAGDASMRRGANAPQAAGAASSGRPMRGADAMARPGQGRNQGAMAPRADGMDMRERQPSRIRQPQDSRYQTGSEMPRQNVQMPAHQGRQRVSDRGMAPPDGAMGSPNPRMGRERGAGMAPVQGRPMNDYAGPRPDRGQPRVDRQPPHVQPQERHEAPRQPPHERGPKDERGGH